MHQFRDGEGTAWKIAIHFGNLPVVKQETGVRLALIEHPILLEGDDPEEWLGEDNEPVPGITRLFKDVELVFEIMFCLVSDQANEIGVSKLDFAKRLSADGVQQKAFLAFWEEVQSFFRSTRKDQIAEGIGQYTSLMKELVRQMTEGLTSNLSSTVASAKTKRQSGELQDTSELTHGRLPTGNLTG